MQSVPLQKSARCLKFQIDEEEDLFYACSENKGADQLRSYYEADLCLCFQKAEIPIFSWRGSYIFPQWLLLKTIADPKPIVVYMYLLWYR